MSTVIHSQPTPAAQSSLLPRHSPYFGGKKRKAEDESDTHLSPFYDSDSMDHQMSSYTSSVTHPRATKKIKSGIQGRPLPLFRLLDTVDSASLKNIIRTVCEKHPELSKEVSELAPQPTVQSALSMLDSYEESYRAAVPYGGNPTGDYAYNRVKSALLDLLEALSDYTPHFLPPNESQPAISFSFLDGATDIIYRLPTWDNPLHNCSKQAAYEEITKAWILVIDEATKKGVGISLQYGGWEARLVRHNENCGGRMDAALDQLRQAVGFCGDAGTGSRPQRQSSVFGFGRHSGVGVAVRSW